MSILIRGMEMPKKCEQCWFFGSDSARVGYCYLLKGELPLPDGVPQDCPLVEVPTPHGRLIDAEWLKLLYDDPTYGIDTSKYHVAVPVILANIDDAPTVIERECE